MSRPTLPELAREGTIHFMGAAGAGMSPLAELVHRSGARVTGCDLRPGLAGRALADLGIEVGAGHDPSHVEGVSALVVSAAVPSDHPEIERARTLGVPVLKRAVALGEWVGSGRVVAVAGTHGKTTTTALATQVLAAAGLDPTGLVGGHVPGWGGNLRAGASDLFVVEADEYDRSFHALRPWLAVVTSLEADHLDIYGTLDGVREAFRTFVASVSPEGAVIACGDDPGASRLLPGLDGRGFSYGLAAGSQLRGVDVTTSGAGSRFRIVEQGKDEGVFELPLPGLHNVRNALAAAAVARRLGAEWSAVRRGLGSFPGVQRRFQRLGRAGGVEVVDDYAHHPTEIEAALAAARDAFPAARIVAVFQPHLFSRTRDFAPEFGEALAAADLTWVTDVYPAREKPIAGVTGELVSVAVAAAGGAVRYHPPLEGLPEVLAAELRDGDVCLTLGAGSVESVGPALLERLGEVAHA